MQIYFPIAEQSLHILLVLGMGGGVGFLSGLFGVGGGFLMTPLLIFVGINPAVAVATEANQIVAASVSGVIAHWRKGNVDFKMGGILVCGGLVGSTLGSFLFKYLREVGQIDLVISISFVIFLLIIGLLMITEGSRAIIRSKRKGYRRKAHYHYWVHGLPLKLRFHRSRLYISLLPPLFIGFVVGILSSIMGVGGGFIMIPAMIYILGMPTSAVIGTSLFQIIFVTSNVTLLHSINTQTVDIVLAVMLLSGAVIGAQFGARLSNKLKGEQLRTLLGIIVLAVCLKLLFDLIIEPNELYSLGQSFK
tara:strand:+ start:2228 stop:3142 length:915 start_codon:yes stop_codon:yes gene_type:complete